MFSSKDLFFTPASTGYTVSKSLRFRKSATAYLSRSYSGGAGNTTTYTLSMWVKRGQLYASGGTQDLFNPGTNTTFGFGRVTNDELGGNLRGTSGTNYFWNTSAVFRDPSAWYHIVLAIDTTQTTLTNQVKLYINGVLQSITGTACPQNTAQLSTATRYIGTDGGGGAYLDGYIAETYFINGSQKAATDFGAYDTNGVWQPAAYTGSYGTNDFYLQYTDVGATSGSNAGYGKDFSGNSNYWTTNNFGTTSTLTTYDSMIDSPTNYADGGNGRGNYATFNPLAVTSVAATFADGNLTLTTGLAGGNCYGTFAIPTSGKWYWEITVGSANNPMIGISAYLATQTYAWQNGNSVFYYYNGQKYVDGTASTYNASYTTNNVIGVAVDADAGTITFYKDNSSQGAITHTVAGLFPCLTDGASGTTDTFYANFGQRPFAYTPPSGFSALNTQNLTTPTITNGAAYMAAVTYTGTGSSQTITASSTNSGNNPNGTTFQPDFVWVKSRSAATDHALYDAVRGVQLQLESNTTTAETTETTGLTAFTSSGFTTGALAQMNTNTATYVAWEWNAGGSNATNTTGSIQSTVRANTSAGFSVVTYTGNSAASATIGHGLGVVPSMLIIKHRNGGGDSWGVWHSAFGTASNTDYLLLNTTGAKGSAGSVNLWNSTIPTSTVFSIGNQATTNINAGLYVAYCFAPVSGYSAFGSYTGNGSTDGPMIFTGFRPRYVMIKVTSTTGNWVIKDTSRITYNANNLNLFSNLSVQETTEYPIDILSNGFKIRETLTDLNASGGTYIYAAFAENPFKISRAR